MQSVIRYSFRRICNQIPAKRHSSSYIILLPEEPEDTPETNAVLKHNDGELSDFTDITMEKCSSGVARRVLDCESGIWDIEKQIVDDPESVTFSSVVERLDGLDSYLYNAWNTASILYQTRNDVMSHKAYLSLHQRAQKARYFKLHSKPIHDACKTLLVNNDNGPHEQRVLEKLVRGARLNGVPLGDFDRKYLFRNLLLLDEKTAEFGDKVKICNNRFIHTIRDPAEVKDYPEDLLKFMSPTSDSKSGPWEVSLQPGIYHGFLESCPRRLQRWNAWKAYNIRGTTQVHTELNNNKVVNEIRDCREIKAKKLGYPNFASMSLESKMAGSVENVLAMIGSLRSKAVPQQTAELASLIEYAQSVGFEDKELKPWDIPYYSRVQCQHLYSTGTKTSDYFPLPHVLGVLLQLCSQLFGVQFEEVDTATVEGKPWHPSVRLFNVIDEDGSKVASFYIDPYARPGQKLNPYGKGGVFTPQRTMSSVNGTPIGALIFNFPAPTSTTDSLLSLGDVTALFSTFGEALQQLLSTVYYTELSGVASSELDALPMCKNFMANWVMVPSILSALSHHHETGASFTDDNVNTLISASNHMAGLKLSEQLYYSELDMVLHTSNDHWHTLVKQVWPRFMTYPQDKYDYHMCSFGAIMCDGWEAAYYSHTWSKVMAADCLQAFRAADSEDWSALGKRFRSTFLAEGGGCHPSELFRRFRGRDPSPDALTELYGMAGTAVAAEQE